MPRRPGPVPPTPDLEERVAAGIPRARAAIGVRLGRLRVEKNLTYYGLGQKAGMNGTHVMNIERGTTSPQLETLAKLASFFGFISVEQLFGPLPSEELVRENRISPPSDQQEDGGAGA